MEDILQQGYEYCKYISLLIKNGFPLEEAKKEEAEKIASYKDIISERIKNRDFARDALFASCEKVWATVGSLYGEAKAQALLRYFGVDIDPSEWLYRSKSSEEVITANFIFIGEYDDKEHIEPVEFEYVPGLTASVILEKCKKNFDGYWYKGANPELRSVFKCEETQYMCDWGIVTKRKYL